MFLFARSKMTVTPKSTSSSVLLPISDRGIAFPSDIKYLYGNFTPTNFNPTINENRGGYNFTVESGGVTPKENQRFMNWMRLAALPNFRKLWGRIDRDLVEGSTVSGPSPVHQRAA